MQRAALLVSVLVFAGIAIFFYGQTSLTAPSRPPVTTQAPSESAYDLSWWPLAPRTMWRYEVLRGGPFRTRGYFVQEVSPEGIALVLENTDGKQTDNFRVRSGPGDQVEFREYQAAKGSMLYLPETLEEATRWDLREDLRAVAMELESVTIPCLGEPREALRIEYESYFSAAQTEQPGWYPAGTRWMVRGVGLVQEDLEGAEAPPELKDLVDRNRHFMRLSEFKAPWKKN